jgi:hypothetical protein
MKRKIVYVAHAENSPRDSREAADLYIRGSCFVIVLHLLGWKPCTIPTREPLVLAGDAAVLVVFWLILYWMYRRRIFLRI